MFSHRTVNGSVAWGMDPLTVAKSMELEPMLINLSIISLETTTAKLLKRLASSMY